MTWRAKCDECQQEAGISRPFFETKDLFLASTLLEKQILEKAVAHYETHPRSAADARRAARPECRCRAPTCSSPTRQRPMTIRRLGRAEAPADRARHQTHAVP